MFSTQSSPIGVPGEKKSEMGSVAFKSYGKTFKPAVTSALLTIIPNKETK